jgi:hypothetical protein
MERSTYDPSNTQIRNILCIHLVIDMLTFNRSRHISAMYWSQSIHSETVSHFFHQANVLVANLVLSSL